MSGANNALYRLNESINSFQQRLNAPVDRVYQSSVNINETTTRILNKIEEFQENLVKGEQTQLAHENIIRIDQLMKERFGDYEAIRKTVMGIVRDFDVNLVRNSTITDLSEELWISSSRYWLSYALIAITAWVNDYPEVARNALSESGRRDAIKTTLFFCLTNLRFERMDAAKKWFCEYIKILDPKMLQQETAVLLQAFLNGIFGKDKELEHEVLDLIEEWMRILNEDAEACQALVESYVVYIKNMRSPVKFSYSSILQYCRNKDQVARSYEEVAKYDQLLEFVRSLDVELEEQNDENYRARVDAVLMNLITRYDEEELSLKDQQAYYQYIVENQGVIQKAEAQYQQRQELQNSSFNIGKQMMRWALFDADGTDIQVRKFGFQNTKDFFTEGVNRWDIQLQQDRPLNFELAIDDWTGVSNGTDFQEQRESMHRFFDSNKFHYMYINTWNIALVLAVILSVGLAFLTPYALVVTALAAGFLAFRVLKAMKEYPQRVERAKAALDAVLAEIAEYRLFFDDKRQLKDELISAASFL